MTSVMMAGPTSAPFGSVLTAMVTPFGPDGSVDLVQAQQLASHLVEHGHDGLVVSGTTGESPTTSDAEKSALLQAVVEAVGDRAKVVAGVGTSHTEHSIELARAAAKAGASGLLVVTPYYSKPPQAGILAHFTAIADSTDLPVMLYDIPGRSGVRLEPQTLIQAAQHSRILAVKDATGDLDAGSWTMARTDLAFYSGDDALTLAWLALGAVGTVSVVGHVAGMHYRRMIEAMASADLDAARQIHTELLPVVRAIMSHTQGAIMVKAALQKQGVLSSRAVRSPLVAATEEELLLLPTEIFQSPFMEACA